MSAFSSSRKEDISLRLRAQNTRNAKEETKKLEHESQKMEERLRELKMAMNREKEERERRGGGFWQTGQTGTLNKYATEVLTTKPEKRSKDSAKKKTIKVLKDTPLDIPERSSQPGTMKFIAQQKPEASGKENRFRGPKCGQCENNAAVVTCQQCCEYFCSRCFAAFHMKGALRRHRSVSIQAAGPRQCMSPHPTPPTSARDVSNRQSYSDPSTSEPYANGTANSLMSSSQGSSSDASPERLGEPAPGSLLYGEFNEEESAAAFQEAVMAFRTGGAGDASHPPRQQSHPPSGSSHTPRYSPKQTSVSSVQVDSGTDMVERRQTPEVTFKEVNVGYLNRLMLKQHRRTDLAQLPSPQLNPSSNPPSLSPSDQEEMPEDHVPVLTENSLHALNMEVEACRMKKQSSVSRTSSGISVIALSDSLVPGVRKESCVVTEVDPLEAWAVNNNADVSAQHSPQRSFQTSLQSSAPGSSGEGDWADRHPAGLPSGTDSWEQGRFDLPTSSRPRRGKESQHGAMEGRMSGLPPVGASSSQTADSAEDQISPNTKPPPSARRKSLRRGEGVEREASTLQEKSAKSRPVSSRSMKSRPRSSMQSRPGSRAKSRATGEGVLTKTPGTALKSIAQRSTTDSTHTYNPSFDDFFTLGVAPMQEERTLTPTRNKRPPSAVSGARPGSATLKVSNKLYQMAPRSWRPDSSLSDYLPAEEDPAPTSSNGHSEDQSPRQPLVLSYAYSGQLSGQAVAVRRGSLDMDEPEEELQMENDSEEEDEVAPTLPPPSRGDFSPTRSSELTGSDLVAFAREASRLTRSGSGVGPRPRSTPRPLSGTRRTPSAYAEALSRQSFTRTPLAPLTPSPPPSDPPTPRRPRSGRTPPQVSTPTPQVPSPRTVLTVTSPRPLSVFSRPPSSTFSRPPTARPESRVIVMDGEDLSKYDEAEVERQAQQNKDDTEALDKLEWELASECGRITAEGKISQMSQLEDMDSFSSGSSTPGAQFNRQSTDLGFDINSKLREDEMSDDRVDNDDEADVRALP